MFRASFVFTYSAESVIRAVGIRSCVGRSVGLVLVPGAEMWQARPERLSYSEPILVESRLIAIAWCRLWSGTASIHHARCPSLKLAQRPERGTQLLREQLRLFPRRKVTALVDLV